MFESVPELSFGGEHCSDSTLYFINGDTLFIQIVQHFGQNVISLNLKDLVIDLEWFERLTHLFHI